VAASPTLVGAKDNREKLLERAMSRHQYSGDALIEVLHTAQELFGLLSRPLLKTIAHLVREDWLLPLSTTEMCLPE